MKWFFKHKFLFVFIILIICFSVGFLISYKNSHEFDLIVNYNKSLQIDNVLVDFEKDGKDDSNFFNIVSIRNEIGKTVVRLRANDKGKASIKINCKFKENVNEVKSKVIYQSAYVNGLNMIFLGDKLTDYISIRYLFYAFCILIGILSVISFINFKFNLKSNKYSQKTILVGAMFIFLTIMFLIYSIAIIYTSLNYEAINIKLLSLITSNVMAFSIIFLIPFLFIYVLILSISNIKLYIKEGFKFRNSLGLIFSFVMFIGLIVMCILLYLSKILYVNNLILSILFSICSSLFVLFESLLFSTIICSIYVTKKKIDYGVDYIIILGCRISKDGTLLPLIKGRVDKAIDLYNKQIIESNKKLIFVPSGGKGNDEIISEAEAMKNYLVSQGISEEQIIVENKSTDTMENFKFSKALIDKNKKIIFSTTNYHVFRSGLIAKQAGLDIDGIGSKTKWYFWPNAFTREIVGIFVQSKKQMIILTLITILIGLSTFIYTFI